MISEPKFSISFDSAVALLNKLKIFKGRGPKNTGDYSSDFLKTCRSNKHSLIYKTAIDNLDYEIILIDDSLLQLSRTSNILRYCFIQNPNYSFSKIEFLKYIYSEDELFGIDEETLNSLILDVDENEYEQFLNEQELNLTATIIRYDYDMRGYTPLLHSCSHLHIGINENFRIPCSIILTPLQFVIFCLKQIYLDTWSEEFKTNTGIITYLENAKKDCMAMVANWNKIEEHDIYVK